MVSAQQPQQQHDSMKIDPLQNSEKTMTVDVVGEELARFVPSSHSHSHHEEPHERQEQQQQHSLTTSTTTTTGSSVLLSPLVTSSVASGEDSYVTNDASSTFLEDAMHMTCVTRDSDFTVPTSNTRAVSPPPCLVFADQDQHHHDTPLAQQAYTRQHQQLQSRYYSSYSYNKNNNDDNKKNNKNNRKVLANNAMSRNAHKSSSESQAPNTSSSGPTRTPSWTRDNGNKPNRQVSAPSSSSSSSSLSSRRNIFGVVVEERYRTTTDFSYLHSTPSMAATNVVVLGGNRQQVATTTTLSTAAATTTTGINSNDDKNNSHRKSNGKPCSSRRNIFGGAVEIKYQTSTNFSHLHPPTANDDVDNMAKATSDCPTFSSELTIDLPQSTRPVNADSVIGTTSPSSPSTTTTARSRQNWCGMNSCLTTKSQHHHQQHHHTHKTKRPQSPHETIHAQTLLLGLAFCAVWSPSNVMAPNLTEMAEYFQFDNTQRDLYLGSYCALATGVFSFPIGAGIGILADRVNRRYLFCSTLVGGALAALATGQAQSYPQFLLGRLVNGGFMAGSVPVAFSFLGDLFAVEERNAASSGLTAMMGLGIIIGQVYAGTTGPTLGWQHAFTVSAVVTLCFSIICLILVQEPERGGKERVLQDMIRAGTRYERKLSWKGFWHSCLQNSSNSILLWQGFFSSLPWGVIFVFLNDYLSQERGFSVPAATYLVFLFGMGCAAGGVLGGYLGQLVQGLNRRYLPLFMAITTELALVPFVGMLNVKSTRAHGPLGILFAFGSGLIASLPSVNVRPCLINVNPPEARGAALTAANLLIQLGRGMGPSCVTLMVSLANTSREEALNLTLCVFRTISALQLVWLSKTLPKDQDAMESELAKYAATAIEQAQWGGAKPMSVSVPAPIPDDAEGVADATAPLVLTREPSEIIMEESMASSSPLELHQIPQLSSTKTNVSAESYQSATFPGDASVEVSIEDRMTYFDGSAVNQTLDYVRQGFKEFKQELVEIMPCHACADIGDSSSEDSNGGVVLQMEEDGNGDEIALDKKDMENKGHNGQSITQFLNRRSKTNKTGNFANREGQTRAQHSGQHHQQQSSSLSSASLLLYHGVPPTIRSMSSLASNSGTDVPATEETSLLPG